MVTIHREAGMRFVIYSDDHEPAHVHVAAGGSANLLGLDGAPELVRSFGLKTGELRKAMRIASERQEEFLRKWNEIHG